jgi:iron(III) transport system permease protein
VAERRATALWAVSLAALAVLVGFPLLELLRAAAGAGAWAAVEGAGGAVANTLWTSAAAAVIALLIGAGAALAVERGGLPFPRTLRAGLLVPLVVPAFVSAFAWGQAYGPGGLTYDLLGLSWPEVFGAGGVVAVLVVEIVPLAYLVVAAALAGRARPDLERAARMAGAGPGTAFRTVTLPLLRPALVAAGGIGFVVAANSFGVPALLGLPAGFGTMTTRIYQDLVRSAAPQAFASVLALSGALVAVTAGVVVSTDAAAGLGAVAGWTAEPTGSPEQAGRRRGWAGLLLAVWVAATSVLPLAALALTALAPAPGVAPTPAAWTLENFRTAFAGRPLAALRTSLLLAVAAAALAVVLGGIAAALGKRKGGRAVGRAVVLTFALPGSALAVSMLLAYGGLLRDTPALILLAYLGKFWALGHRPLAGSLEALAPEPGRAARASGAGPLTALRTVTIPMLAPALVVAALVVFLFALHELTMSSLLHGPGAETLAVVILDVRSLGDVNLTAALACLLAGLLLAGAGAVALLRRRIRR